MSYDFSADEIFEMAEQLERNGGNFYRKAASEAKEPVHKKLLEELAAMEDEHEKTFAAMRADLAADEKNAAVFDPEGDAERYLKALVETKVFFKKEIDFTSMREILKSAIEAEKDAIIFFLGMREAVPGTLGKDKIDAVIKEEMGHIRMISRELAAVGK